MIWSLLFLVSIAFIEAYIYLIKRVNGGILPSISESWYVLTKNGYSKKLFTLIIWLFAGPITFFAAYNEHWFLLVAGSLIMVVGVSPEFKLNKYEHTVHMIGAYGGCILSIVSLLFDFGTFLWPYITICIIAYLTILKTKYADNKIWVIEVVIIRSMYLFLVTQNIFVNFIK